MRRLVILVLVAAAFGCRSEENPSNDLPSRDSVARILASLDTTLVHSPVLAQSTLDSLHHLRSDLRPGARDSLALLRVRLDLQLGKYGQAVRTADSVSLLPVGPEFTSENELFRGRALTRLGDFNRAQVSLRRSLAIRDSLFGREDLRTAEALHYVGLAFHEAGLHEKALEFYSQALAQRRILAPNSAATAATFNNIGNIYWRRGELRRALQMHSDALRLKTAASSTASDLGISHSNLANLYAELRHDERADYHFATALRLYEQGSANPLFLATVYNDLGNHLWNSDRKDEAEPHWERAIRLYQAVLDPDQGSVGIAQTNLAASLVRSGRFEDGLELFQEGIAKILKDRRPNSALIMAQFAEVVSEAGRQAQADLILSGAMKWQSTRSGPTSLNSLRLQRTAARFTARKNRLDGARRQIEQAIITNRGSLLVSAGGSSADVVSYAELLEAWGVWASIVRETLDRGQWTPDRSASVLDSFEAAISDLSMHRILHLTDEGGRFITLNQLVLDVAVQVAFTAHQLDPSRASFQRLFRYSELRHAEQLRHAIGHGEAVKAAQIPSALVDLEKGYREELWTINRQQAAGRVSSGGSFHAQAARRYELEDSLRHLIRMYEVGYPEYHRIRYSVQPSALRAVQASLNEDEALLLYHVIDDHLLAMLVSTNSASSIRLGRASWLEREVAQYLTALHARDRDVVRITGLSLSNRLLGPLKRLETFRNWIVVPDGALLDLPFDALPAAGPNPPIPGTQEYLIQNHLVRYAHSATTLVGLRRESHEFPANGLLVAAPVFSGGRILPSELLGRSPTPTITFPELRGTGREAVALDHLFDRYRDRSSEPAQVLLGQEATEARLKSADLTPFQYIHLATHGHTNSTEPSLSGLLFEPGDGEDGVLHVGEVLGMELNADMVVLSACRTGITSRASGAGLMGLSRAFMYAGTNTVVASLWNSDDAYTASTMAHFYENLLQGQSKAEALRQAKLTMMEDPEVAATPELWAPFILIGES